MSELMLTSAADVQPQPVSWVWPGRIARGKVTLLAGDPGLGKSFVTCDVAARVSAGLDWPDGPTPLSGPGDVVILNAEDDAADTLRPRLEAAGADLSRVRLVEGVDRPGDRGPGPVALDRDVDAIRRALRRCERPRLVVIDPVSAFMGGADANSNAEVRGVLAELSRCAAVTGAAVLCVTHLNKGGGQAPGAKIVYRAMGSLAFTAAARMVWYVSALGGDDRARAVTLVKSNLPGAGGGMTFELRDGRVAWLETGLAMTADEAEGASRADDEDGPGAVVEAARFIAAAVEQAGGEIEAGRLIALAQEAGISLVTLKRAKRVARVEARKAGGRGVGWVWARTDGPAPGAETARP